MKKNISTLEELELEQKKLKMTMELTKQAFAENLGTNRHQIKDFLLKNVALPGGAIGLGVAAINKAVSVVNDKKEHKVERASSSGLLDKALPLALSFAQAYLFKMWGKEEVKDEITTNPTDPTSRKHTLKKVV